MLKVNLSRILKVRYFTYLFGASLLFVKPLMANQIDNEILQLTKQNSQVDVGKTTFNNICAGCHAKDLSGGAGFNLKDETWVHGNTPSDILINIKKGFPNAGMPALGAVFNDQQLKQVVAYILSKREGFSELNYKIYPIETQSTQKDFEFDKKITPSKQGKLPTNLIDFALPEVESYVIEFDGTFHAPNDKKSNLFAVTNRNHRTELFVNGELVKPIDDVWQRRVWPLVKGKQNIRLRYYRINMKPNYKSKVDMFVADENYKQKLYGVSVSGKQFLSQSTFPIKAESKPVLLRKKVVDLPTYSISIGYPSKVNYAFNTKTCSIVGLWSGDLLNVGPNVEDRARDGAIILGDWQFKAPQTIAGKTSQPCTFNKYLTIGNTSPKFFFSLGDNEYSLVAKPSDKAITFIYEKISGSQNIIQWKLPVSQKVSISSNEGTIQNNQLTLNKNTNSWQVTVKLIGKKS